MQQPPPHAPFPPSTLPLLTLLPAPAHTYPDGDSDVEDDDDRCSDGSELLDVLPPPGLGERDANRLAFRRRFRRSRAASEAASADGDRAGAESRRINIRLPSDMPRLNRADPLSDDGA